MKTLSPTLLAAQRKRHRRPCVEAVIRDFEQGIARLSWSRIYTGSEAESHHDIAIDGNGNLHRIRVVGSTLYRQRQAWPWGVPTAFPHDFPFPLEDPLDLSSWTQVTTDCNGPCAIAAYGEKVYIFYRQNSVNQLRYYYSHTYGDTWTDAVFRAYTGVISMAACFWSSGPNVMCFTLRTNEISVIVWNTDTQAFVRQRIVTFTSPYPHIITNTYGIGATYSSRASQCQIVFAGLESGSPYNHYNLYRCTLSALHYFSDLESIIMAPDGENTTYEYPDCHFPITGQDYEETRITLVEKFAGTAAYERPLTCHVVKDTLFSDAAFTEPRPFVDVSSDYGLRLATSAQYWFLSRPDGLWRAPRTPLAAIDITGDIVAITQRAHAVASAELASGPGTLVITLDNSRGQYSNLPSPWTGEGSGEGRLRRAELELRLGYVSTAGAEVVTAGTYWLDSWQYQSTSLRGEGRSNLSTFTLYCLDGWSLANRWTPRYQLRWNHPAATPHNVWTILFVLLARIGIRLRDGAWPRSDPILNFYPDFTLVPGQRGDTAIRRLLATVPDQLVFRGQDAFVKDPRPDEPPCYSYHARGPTESFPSAHPIAAGKYGHAVTASRTRAIGRDALKAPVIADVFDWDLQQLYDYLVVAYDANLATAAEAQDRATAVLRTLALEAHPAAITVPANVGQELLDVVEVSDPRCGISQEKYRVQEIRTLYDRRKGQYDQRLSLGTP